MRRLFLIATLFFISFSSHASSVTIQSTTSTRDSGLYEYLLPYYPEFNKKVLNKCLHTPIDGNNNRIQFNW